MCFTRHMLRRSTKHSPKRTASVKLSHKHKSVLKINLLAFCRKYSHHAHEDIVLCNMPSSFWHENLFTSHAGISAFLRKLDAETITRMTSPCVRHHLNFGACSHS